MISWISICFSLSYFPSLVFITAISTGCRVAGCGYLLSNTGGMGRNGKNGKNGNVTTRSSSSSSSSSSVAKISGKTERHSLVKSFFEPAAPTLRAPFTKKRGLQQPLNDTDCSVASDEQEQAIKRPKEGGSYREELLLSQRSRQRCR